MDFDQYKIAFEKEASNQGYSLNNIQRCLAYAEVLFSRKIPVIYNTSHLSALVGYQKDYIKRAAVHTPFFYRRFVIPKKNGKSREIAEPLPSLKEIQNWILNNILYNIHISPFAKAYKPKTRLIENLKFHQAQPKVLTIDIQDFFGSIKTASIENIFRRLGYSQVLSNLLAKICTLNNCLPQGAPTSPCLSNIFFLPADNLIASYCMEKKIRYTRYADDLSFSGEFEENALIAIVTKSIDSLGLSINQKKTKVMKSGNRQTVTGIVVNEKAQVVFHKRNTLRQEIYYIKRFGLEEHKKRKEITQANYLEHLMGRVNFVLQLNPKDKEFQEYKSYLNMLRTGVV